MRIAVVGVGAVGGYFGARLVEAGENVLFLARGETLKTLESRGLRIESPKGDAELHPIQVTGQAAAPVDAVLLAVKATQVRGIAHSLAPFVGPETILVTLQNGVEAPGELAEVFGTSAIVPGVARIISYQLAPAHIRHLGGEPSITLGELAGGISERALRLRDVLRNAKVSCEVAPDARAALWEKFVFVVAWGGVGAVTRAPIGVLRTLPETREMLQRAATEIYSVGRAHQIPLAENLVEKTMMFYDLVPPASTTSLQRDIAKGRASELSYWTGSVLRLATEAGVDAPINRFLYYSLLPQEQAARSALR